MIEVRKANESDLELIEYFTLGMINESDRYAKLGVNPSKVMQTVKSFIESDDKGVVLMAQFNGAIVGGFIGALSDEWCSDNFTAFDLVNYIDPEFRGLGVSRELVQSFIQWAKERGAKFVNCGTNTGVNTEHAINLYGSMGFVNQGVFMELEL